MPLECKKFPNTGKRKCRILEKLIDTKTVFDIITNMFLRAAEKRAKYKEGLYAKYHANYKVVSDDECNHCL